MAAADTEALVEALDEINKTLKQLLKALEVIADAARRH